MRSPPVLAALLWLALLAQTNAVTNVFEYPAVFRKHVELTGQFKEAMQKHDAPELERVCRMGVALLPENPVWRYNLACSLSLQKRTDEALQSLDRAIELGYRDADAIEQDSDLQDLQTLPAFRPLLAKARLLSGKPVGPPLAASPVSAGAATVSASNTTWDFDLGRFRSFFAWPTNPAPPAGFAAAWNGPDAFHVRAWMASNNAAGNFGDLYDNRDSGHSALDTARFPGMTSVRYDANARAHGAHYGLSTFLFNGVTIGNSSVAMTTTPYWRSVPRAALTEGPATAFLFLQYLNNMLYIYPSHRDCDPKGLGDVYPVNQPYVLIAQGASGSDRPFLEAVAATLAAFTPEVKRYLANHNLLMPTVQMILRRCQKTVLKPDDYLSGRAHPSAFDGSTLDVPRMTAMAHALGTNDVPPIVALRTLDDQPAVPGVDFFDLAASEGLYDTPNVIARIVRNVAFRHTMLIGAQLSSPDPRWRLHWVVLRGDASRISLLPMNPEQTRTRVSVAYHTVPFAAEPDQPLQTSRVDLGVFASDGRIFSAPSFVSFFFLNNEIRRYTPDGRILSVDYAAAANRYVDPMLSLAKHWRDEYRYDNEQRLTGWTRRCGEAVEQFSPRGERIESTDTLGRPTLTRTVSYIVRTVPDGTSAPDLVAVDGEFQVKYRYASDSDTTGEMAGRERVR